MEIGKEEKKITIEPLETPIKRPAPEREPEPVKVPRREKEKVPA